jgi:hypothetical protein
MFEGKTLLLSGPQVDYTNYRGGLRKNSPSAPQGNPAEKTELPDKYLKYLQQNNQFAPCEQRITEDVTGSSAGSP